MRSWMTLLGTALAAILGLTLVSPTAATAATPGFTVSYQTILGDGGTPIRAFVVQPTGRGDGPFPVLVMPSSWGVLDIEYVGAAAKLAYESGYVVVSYTSRGFWDSGGQIEVAGAPDIADASKVIDWALANTKADPAKIGMGGISYGAGISLLTSAADRRVKAVAALSGWTDLIASMYPNTTVNEQGAALLLALGNLTGRPGADLKSIQNDYLANDFAHALPLAATRSAANRIDAINANHPAIMLGNAWEDSFFPPSQLTDFYQKLTGPKRLMLSPGDHATPELFGAAGLPNDIWASAGRWFDHYLRGVDNGIDRESPVSLKPANGGDWRGFPDWPSVSAQQSTRYLGKPVSQFFVDPPTGALGAAPAGNWNYRINAGWPTIAESGTAFVAGTLQGFLNVPTGVSVPFIDRGAAGVWSSPDYPTATTVSGAPRLHVTVTPSAANTSLFGYLYDVDAIGLGSLITHKPISLRDAKPGVAQAVDLALEPIYWNVPAGHHLVLAVDTMDARYRSTSTIGSTVSFSSPAADPSWLRF
ncbi:CocE/NonD family hydrolase [Solihabitans fulvus]|uniref:CocE/NonD family hydrolase n=1 Tax=Solihabitans fulvus TaxID=1892852 RepID=A0A5B2XJK9_9PSEU|nr:CocE/NonD family hydrolase [Solihabitans fulvus]KAA2264038.1 CocE/NonD family hydrolase [Solihabitans fulvus]